MRKLRMLMMMGCIPMILGAEEYKEPEKINLNKGWEFSQVGKSEWLPAKVPGTVHQDLINHGMIPNPFYGKNEEKVQWVENEDWTYRTTFNVTDEQLAREAAVLEFEGLDTYADIYLNGSLLERTDNMFVGYTLPVKEVLRKGENRLQVYFHSPIKQALANCPATSYRNNKPQQKNYRLFAESKPSTPYPYNIANDSMNQERKHSIRRHPYANALSYQKDGYYHWQP